jgi:peptidyl-prolyl cis-trans isomerase D
VARGEGRVILVQLDKIIPADLPDDAGKQLSASVTEQLSQGLGQDIFEYYARAAQAEAGITLDSAAVNAVISQMQ